MARHEPPSTVEQFGIRMKMSTIPDVLTGGPLLPEDVFDGNAVEDRSIYYMGQDNNGWPLITTEASVVKHLDNIRQSISDHTDTSRLHNEDEHREYILATGHVRGLVWYYRNFGAVLRFGSQHLFKFNPLTWYAEMDLVNRDVIPYIQEILTLSLLTHTATFSVTAKLMTGARATTASSRIMSVAKARALQTRSVYDHGEIRFYILPSSAGSGSTSVKFDIVIHWIPDVDDADALGERLEEEHATLQVLHLCQTDANIKTKSLKSSERMFVQRVGEGNDAIQEAVQHILGMDDGANAYSLVREFSVDVDGVNTYFHSSMEVSDTLHVFMNSRPAILSRRFYSVAYPSYKLLRMTGPVEGGLFPSHFAEEEETHHLFGAKSKDVVTAHV